MTQTYGCGTRSWQPAGGGLGRDPVARFVSVFRGPEHVLFQPEFEQNARSRGARVHYLLAPTPTAPLKGCRG
jgi:hypothetical protein